jgi:hypothetical protein
MSDSSQFLKEKRLIDDLGKNFFCISRQVCNDLGGILDHLIELPKRTPYFEERHHFNTWATIVRLFFKLR